MKRLLFFLLLFHILISVVKAQDPVFSQYYINSIHLNPAIAGSANDPRVFMHYRNQWPAIGNTFISYQGSYDQYIKEINGGIGVNVFRDNIGGVLTNTSLDMIYSYRFKASRQLTMQAGLQASFNFLSKNTSGLVTRSSLQNDLPMSQSSTQPDFGAGILGMTRNTQFGLSLMHLNTGFVKFNYNYIDNPIKISLFYSRKIKIYNPYKVQDNGFYLTPALLVQSQGSSVMINYGAGVRIGDFLAGGWMRTNLPLNFSAAIFSVGYAFNNITIGYSYDYNMLSMSKLMPVTGAHEITMVAIFPLDPKRGRYSPVKCPSAFVQ